MKQKRTFIVLAIVIAVLALGIAYAAVTARLEIYGNATGSFDTDNFQVYFSGYSDITYTGIATDDQNSEVGINQDDKTMGYFNFTGFTTVGQKQSATWTILNDNDAGMKAINVKAAVENAGTNTENFKVTITKEPAQTIEANGSTEVTVEVECIKTPEAAVSSTGIVIGIDAEGQAQAATSGT